MENYIVLDLETPNRYSNSMSSLGIVVVENSEIVDEIYSLINPEAEFDDFNIAFTGIGPEDVADAPTFPDYYEKIEDLLLNNIIVGQNITFDLSVISKSLTRYNMPIPSYKYYCTLSSCKRNLNLPSNSLNYIVHNVLNTDYNAHNAMADAQMTNELFKYLDSYENNRKSYVKTYYYRPNCKRDFNRSLDYNFNYLYGLLLKIDYTCCLSDNHYQLLMDWYNRNICYNNHLLLKNVLLKVKYLLYRKDLTKRDTKNILNLMKPILRSPVYKSSNLKLQIFLGLLDSIICEETIQDDDLNFMTEWIEESTINDKTFKNFYKKLDYDEEDLKAYLMEYSSFLKEYLK